MQAKVLATAIILGVFGSLILLLPTGFSGDLEEREEFYKSCIIKKIKKCDSKVVLLSSSKSKNLKEHAMIEAQKAAFLDKEKEKLVERMVEMKMEPKDYKVELFLNSQFQKKVRHVK